MPLAGTHIVTTMLVLAGIRKYLKIKFSNRLLLFGGVLGLLPDIDIPIAIAINFISGTNFYFHKFYTHALIIPIILFVISILMKYFNPKIATVVLISSIGWAMHITLDCYLAVGIQPSIFPGFIWPIGICTEIVNLENLVIIDAVFVTAFVLYLAYKT